MLTKISLYNLYLAIFELQAILREVHKLTPKWPWRLNGQQCPMYMLQLPSSPHFQSVSLYVQPFSSHRPLWVKCTEWPKMTLNTKGQMCPIYMLQLPKNAKIPAGVFFFFFLSCRPFQDKCTEYDPNNLWRLKTRGLRERPLCGLSQGTFRKKWVCLVKKKSKLQEKLFEIFTPIGSYANENFALYLAIFELQVELQSVSLYGKPFSSYRPFWDKCTEWPKMTLNTKRS